MSMYTDANSKNKLEDMTKAYVNMQARTQAQAQSGTNGPDVQQDH